ncbi:MAG: small multi-drug resistant family protein [Candidatus Muproteobacteria bacterium RBG_16_60_9]|uniref:Small multi-drug resistant family protein n=1 Tax=Candidatus Muproteobacteria bacterium RBG_16_60_9 TaxID=1817755 RepID=A0A1F6V096_9PROT|nr:MAG: small multi-drug resistant family protein [Candidatus Muproteobacteria bacterium RBG_16_60_9]
MSLKIFSLVLISVALSALAQIALKFGMASAAIQRAMDTERWIDIGHATLINPYILGGLGVYGLSVATWLLVLARVDVSVAYPFVGLGFILTMFLGALLLHEPVGALRIVGTLLVAVGVVCIAQSS